MIISRVRDWQLDSHQQAAKSHYGQQAEGLGGQSQQGQHQQGQHQQGHHQQSQHQQGYPQRIHPQHKVNTSQAVPNKVISFILKPITLFR